MLVSVLVLAWVATATAKGDLPAMCMSNSVDASVHSCLLHTCCTPARPASGLPAAELSAHAGDYRLGPVPFGNSSAHRDATIAALLSCGLTWVWNTSYFLFFSLQPSRFATSLPVWKAAFRTFQCVPALCSALACVLFSAVSRVHHQQRSEGARSAIMVAVSLAHKPRCTCLLQHQHL